MKTFSTLLIYLVAATLRIGAAPPNVIFIFADDQGWNALSTPMDPSVGGSKSDYHQTPNTDRLVREDIRFTNGYAPAPVCSPTRHSIQFGISPAKTRVTHNNPKYKQLCEPKLALASLIKKADSRYATAHFGKWHVSETPEACGYDESDGDTGNREGSNSENKKDPKRTFEVTERAIDFLERKVKAKQPFYLQVSYYADHLRFKASPESLKKYEALPPGERHIDPLFAGMNEDLDTGVGQILGAIDRLEIADNTYVIYTADNGYDESPRKLHGNPQRKAWPLSYSKGFVFEGGIHVPFIIRGPGIRADSVSRVPVIGYDLKPTILDWIAGHPKASGQENITARNFSGSGFRVDYGDSFHRSLLTLDQGLLVAKSLESCSSLNFGKTIFTKIVGAQGGTCSEERERRQDRAAKRNRTTRAGESPYREVAQN